MTNEKRLETALRALRLCWNDESGLKVEEAMKNPDLHIASNYTHAGNRALLELYADALNAVETAKAPIGSLSILKKIIKEGDERFNGADEWNGKVYVSSSYRAVRLAYRPENIPAFRPTGHALPFAEAIAGFMEKTDRSNETDVPSVADVKKHLAEFKANFNGPRKAYENAEGYPYNLPGTPVYLRPEPLLDMIALFPNGKVYWSSDRAGVIFKSNEPDAFAEEAILMPFLRRRVS